MLVLGGGMIGSAMAFDLRRSGELEVTVADSRPEVAGGLADRLGVRAQVADLADPEAVKSLASEHHVVLGALPGAMGFRALRAVLEVPRQCCDVSFMPEDPLALHQLAVEQEVAAVVDCGVAPGLSSLMAGWAAARLQPCQRLRIDVGGLPLERRWPFEYKAGFSPRDVIEEYVRPARVVEGGRVVEKEALSEPELIDLPGVGTLEAVLTDGLRTLLTTLEVPDMEEKTLRYPGHAALMRAFRRTGLFDERPLRIGESLVRPLDVTAELLIREWAYAEGEADLTVLRVSAEGRREGRRLRFTWDLLDRHDPASGLRSMSRTTAFVATAVARRMLSGDFRGQSGVFPPEWLGARVGFLHGVLVDLEDRGVRVAFREEQLAG